MTNTVARHFAIINEGLELRDEVFQQLTDAVYALGWTDKKIELSHPLSFCISTYNEEAWESLSKTMKLSIPTPAVADTVNKGIINRLKNLTILPPPYQWQNLTFGQLVTAICADNFALLVDKKNIHSKYEIYLAVALITANIAGIDFYEAGPEKSFTSDLGLD